jgi:hypothetical protein
MLRFAPPCLLLLCLLLAAGPAPAADDCRRVTVEGTVKLFPKIPPQGPRQGMLACAGFGRYRMVLFFAPGGGDVMHQYNTMQLTKYYCAPAGTAGPCRRTIPQGPAWEPVPFTLKASLRPDQVRYTNAQGETTRTTDSLRIWLEHLPPLRPIQVLYQCGGAPAVLPDGGATLNQLLLPWHLEEWILDAKLGEPHTATRKGMDIQGLFSAEVELTVEEVRAPCQTPDDPLGQGGGSGG